MSEQRVATFEDFFGMLDKPVKETDILLCEECGNTSLVLNWMLIEDSVYCEVCGTHDGLRCPNCGEIHDYIFPRIKLIKE